MRTILTIVLLALCAPAFAQVRVQPIGTIAGGSSCPALTAGTYGSMTTATVLTVDADGCLSAVSTVTPRAAGTLTASAPFTFSQTWNDAGVAFRGFNVAVTNTASAAASYPFTVHGGAAGTTSLFVVDKVGNIHLAGGPAGAGGGSLFFYWGNLSDGATTVGVFSPDNTGNLRWTGLAMTIEKLYFHNNFNFNFGLRPLTSGSACLWMNVTAYSETCSLTLDATNDVHVSSRALTAPKFGATSSAPSISGDATLVSGSYDVQGKISSTVTAAGSAVLTFGTAFATAPSCFAANETADLQNNGHDGTKAVSTTTTVTITGVWASGDKIAYACIGK